MNDKYHKLELLLKSCRFNNLIITIEQKIEIKNIILNYTKKELYYYFDIIKNFICNNVSYDDISWNERINIIKTKFLEIHLV